MKLMCKKDYSVGAETEMYSGIENTYFIKDKSYDVIIDDNFFTILGEENYYISSRATTTNAFKYNKILREHFYNIDEAREIILNKLFSNK